MIKLLREHKFLYQFCKYFCTCRIVITQVDDHVKTRLISQLINDISRVLEKLLKYFNVTIISTSFVLPSARVFSVIFVLDLNDSESVRLSIDSSLKYFHKFLDVFE